MCENKPCTSTNAVTQRTQPRPTPSRKQAKTTKSNDLRKQQTKWRLCPANLLPRAKAIPMLLPTSKSASLSNNLIHHLDILQPHSAWICLIPNRIGHDHGVDKAADALTQSLNYYHGGRVDPSTASKAYHDYGHAVQSLRTSIRKPKYTTSEDDLICVALLTLFELVMAKSSPTRLVDVFAHWRGLSALLLALPPHDELSDIVRAIVYSLWDVTSVLYVATGVASPYADDRWLKMPVPTKRNGAVLEEGTVCLRKVGNMMIIQSAELIVYIRSLREGRATAKHALDALRIAQELLDRRQEHIETGLLHRVHVATTKDTETRTVVPCSFTFTCEEDFSAMVVYWSSCATIINPCLELQKFLPTNSRDLDIPQLQADRERYAANLMMCWEYAAGLGPFATAWVAKGLLHIWSTLRRTETFRGVPTKGVRAWLLPRLNHPFVEWLTEENSELQMDVTADLLVGGPFEWLAPCQGRVLR